MIKRKITDKIKAALERQPVVAIIGPRQVGKTTTALEMGKERKSLYLDLESYSDREKLKDAEFFLQQYEDSLVILDEIHRVPEIFQTLRGLVDKGRQKGLRVGRFLVLGSASIDLLRQSGETLAGRIAYIDMMPLNMSEITSSAMISLWIRGGFPDSFLAKTDHDSFLIRQDFIRTYLERDIPQFGVRIPSETLERFWMMLAHCQGTLLNASKLAASLSVSATTISSYIDLFEDLFLIRKLRAFHRNIGKRVIKSPKIYIRDTGLLHSLLNIEDYNELAGHPVLGASWEGFVIESILSAVSDRVKASFYRSTTGAEIDLILEFPKGNIWAIEIKAGLKQRPQKGFYIAIQDIQPDRQFLICAGEESYKLDKEVEVLGLKGMIDVLAAIDP